MKGFLFFSCIFCSSFQLLSQNMKISQAETYYKEFRFADATPIYQELIEKNQLAFSENETVFRHAIVSAEKSHNYDFEYSVMSTLFTSDKCTFDDAYHYFQLTLFLGLYEKATEVLNSNKLNIVTDDPRIKTLKEYRGKVDWSSYLADTTTNKIKAVDFNSGKGDFGVTYHPNGLVFSSARDFSARKTAMDDSYYLDLFLYSKNTGKVEVVKFLESARHDATACYDSTNQIWYYSKNLSLIKGELTTTGIFLYDEKTKKETPFAFNSKDFFTAQPSLSDDGKTLWFSSNRSGGKGNADIWYCIKTDTGWSEPVNAGSTVNSADNEMFPYFQKNKLYFSSNGHKGLGGLDIYSVSFKDNKASNLEHLKAQINSNGDDFAIVLTKDGKTGYFSSNRNGFIDNIYSIELPDLNFVFIGTLASVDQTNPKIQTIPIIVKKDEVVIDTLFADKDGKFEFIGEKNSNYSFNINDNKFVPIKENYSTVGKTESDTTTRTFDLLSKYVDVNTTVFDEESKKPLANATVEIINKVTGEKTTYTSDDKGSIHAELPRNSEFEIKTTHKGYINDERPLNTNTKVEKVSIPVEIKQVQVGSTLNTKELSFDFNKWNLKPDSKSELNGIVKFLKENPTVKIEFSSHTDSRGSDQYNMELSKRRTQSCVNYLVSQGVIKDRIIGKWFGESQIVNQCKDGVSCTDEEHGVNRRTVITVIEIQ